MSNQLPLFDSKAAVQSITNLNECSPQVVLRSRKLIQNLRMNDVKDEEEYSLRAIGWTWGIIAAVIVPILIILVCITFRLFKKNQKQREKMQERSKGLRPVYPPVTSVSYHRNLSDPAPQSPDTEPLHSRETIVN